MEFKYGFDDLRRVTDFENSGGSNALVYTDPDEEWIITALMKIAGGYPGDVQSNNFELNPTEWEWNNPQTYFGIGTGLIRNLLPEVLWNIQSP